MKYKTQTGFVIEADNHQEAAIKMAEKCQSELIDWEEDNHSQQETPWSELHVILKNNKGHRLDVSLIIED